MLTYIFNRRNWGIVMAIMMKVACLSCTSFQLGILADLYRIYKAISYIEACPAQSVLYHDFPDYLRFDLASITLSDSRILLNSFIQSLESLPPCLEMRPELATAKKGLSKVAENLLALDRSLSTRDQYRQMYPLRCWLVWLPGSFIQLTEGDSWILIVLAHFSGLLLATTPIFPNLNSKLSIKVRVESILSIQESLSNTPSLCCSFCHTSHLACQYLQFPISAVNMFL